MTRESSLVESILRRLNAIPGVRAVKRHGSAYTRRGEPDIDCVARGRSIKLEVKRPGKKATKLQEIELRKWRAAGAVAERVENADQAEQIVCNAIAAATIAIQMSDPLLIHRDGNERIVREARWLFDNRPRTSNHQWDDRLAGLLRICAGWRTADDIKK